MHEPVDRSRANSNTVNRDVRYCGLFILYGDQTNVNIVSILSPCENASNNTGARERRHTHGTNSNFMPINYYYKR